MFSIALGRDIRDGHKEAKRASSKFVLSGLNHAKKRFAEYEEDIEGLDSKILRLTSEKWQGRLNRLKNNEVELGVRSRVRARRNLRRIERIEARRDGIVSQMRAEREILLDKLRGLALQIESSCSDIDFIEKSRSERIISAIAIFFLGVLFFCSLYVLMQYGCDLIDSSKKEEVSTLRNSFCAARAPYINPIFFVFAPAIAAGMLLFHRAEGILGGKFNETTGALLAALPSLVGVVAVGPTLATLEDGAANKLAEEVGDDVKSAVQAEVKMIPDRLAETISEDFDPSVFVNAISSDEQFFREIRTAFLESLEEFQNKNPDDVPPVVSTYLADSEIEKLEELFKSSFIRATDDIGIILDQTAFELSNQNRSTAQEISDLSSLVSDLKVATDLDGEVTQRLIDEVSNLRAHREAFCGAVSLIIASSVTQDEYECIEQKLAGRNFFGRTKDLIFTPVSGVNKAVDACTKEVDIRNLRSISIVESKEEGGFSRQNQVLNALRQRVDLIDIEDVIVNEMETLRQVNRYCAKGIDRDSRLYGE